MPWFQERWEALSEKTRKALEVVIGIVIAGGCGFFLLRSGDPDGSMWSIFAAAGIALLLPNIVETQTGNKLPLMRKVFLIGLIAMIVIMLVVAVRSGTPLFNPTATGGDLWEMRYCVV